MNTRNIRFRSNRVRDILSLYHEELDPLYGPGEVAAFGEMLFEAFLGWDRVKLLTSRDHTVNQSDLLRLHWALEDLRRHRPIQHIIGHTDFCGCRIAVTPDVLIPRPETEEMVDFLVESGEWRTENGEWRAENGERGAESRILDLCTGSGCIAIALKKAFSGADVTAVDISTAALAIARQNTLENAAEVTFVQSDILATPKEENKEENKEKNSEEKNFNF
ncbi:MAG: peptide chain release factor N(5)-glutamine methyltransferase [Bacteroidales bacterium]|nr:peptide chain release factor N(5)-glutamine methyltransferase [Bacteroidales bacterium]